MKFNHLGVDHHTFTIGLISQVFNMCTRQLGVACHTWVTVTHMYVCRGHSSEVSFLRCGVWCRTIAAHTKNRTKITKTVALSIWSVYKYLTVKNVWAPSIQNRTSKYNDKFHEAGQHSCAEGSTVSFDYWEGGFEFVLPRLGQRRHTLNCDTSTDTNVCCDSRHFHGCTYDPKK